MKLTKAIFFNKERWEARRKKGRTYFIRQMKTIGWFTMIVCLLAISIRAHELGATDTATLGIGSIILMLMGIAVPFFLGWLAPIEWRTMEARYQEELDKEAGIAGENKRA